MDEESLDLYLEKIDEHVIQGDRLVKLGNDKGDVCQLLSLIDDGDFERAINFSKKLRKEANNDETWEILKEIENLLEEHLG